MDREEWALWNSKFMSTVVRSAHIYLFLFVISGATVKPISHQVKAQHLSYLMKKYIICVHVCFQIVAMHDVNLENTQ